MGLFGRVTVYKFEMLEEAVGNQVRELRDLKNSVRGSKARWASIEKRITAIEVYLRDAAVYSHELAPQPAGEEEDETTTASGLTRDEQRVRLGHG